MKRSLTQSERVSSAAVGKTQATSSNKYTFMTQAQKTEILLNEIVEQECPMYINYKKRNIQTPLMGLKDFKKPRKDPQNHEDYIRFKKMKDNFVKEYKGKLDSYLDNNTKYERRFFKIYHRKDQIYFKHRQNPKDQQQDEVTDMLAYNQILQMNQQQTQRANLNKQQEKRRREMKMEEKEEKEYIKQMMEKFLSEEQKYFDKLGHLEEQGQQKFQEKVLLRNKYTHDYITKPCREFVEKKDLVIGKSLLVPDYINSSVISNAGSQLQIQTQPGLQSPLSSFQQLPSLQNVLNRQNTLSTLYQLPVPQIQEYDLQPSNQIKKPSTFQTQQIVEMFRLITLNEKIEVTFRIVGNPSLLYLEDTNGCTLLHQAALKARNGIAKFLILKGIDLDKQDNKGRTALDIAIKQHNTHLIEYINRVKQKGERDSD